MIHECNRALLVRPYVLHYDLCLGAGTSLHRSA